MIKRMLDLGAKLFFSTAFALMLFVATGLPQEAYAVSCSDVIDPSTSTTKYSDALSDFIYTGGYTYAIAMPGNPYFNLDANINRQYIYDGVDTSSLKFLLNSGHYGAAYPVIVSSSSLWATLQKQFGNYMDTTYVNAWKDFGSGTFTDMSGGALAYSNWASPPPTDTVPYGVLSDKNGVWTPVQSGTATAQIMQFTGKLDCAIDIDALQQAASTPSGTSSSGSGAVPGSAPGTTPNQNDPYAIPNVLCAQDLNLNGTTGDLGEIMNCLKSPQGQFCPVGALDCSTSYQAPVCPTGSTLNTTANMCQADATIVCPSGYTWDNTLDKCTTAPPCPDGGAYNSTTDRCEKLSQPTCPTGYTMDTTANLCYMAVNCPNGGTLNTTTGRCEIATVVTCSSPFTLDTATGRCETAPTCPTGASYSTTYHECLMPAVTTCPSGYTWNSTSGRCEYTPPTCASGTSYNAATKRCEANPTCPSGYTYSASTGNCVETYTASCPSGYTWNGSSCVSTYTATANTNWTGCGGYYSSPAYTCTASPNSGCTTFIIAIWFDSNCNIFAFWYQTYYSVWIPPGTSGYGITNVSTPNITYTCPYGGWISSGNTCSITAAPTCPSGGTLSGNTCTLTSAPTCLAGTTFDGTSGKCIANPTCNSGGTFDSTNNDCWVPTTVCPSGMAYNSSLQQCVGAANCSGGTLDTAANLCYVSTSVGCPTGYTLDSTNNICYTPPLCSPGTYNTTTNRCEAAITQSCGTYAWDPTAALCTQSVICPTDSTYLYSSTIHLDGTLDRCVSDTEHDCVAGTTWASLPTLKCQAVPICTGGIYYDTTTHSCLQSVGCPFGSQYTCMQNPDLMVNGQGGWQCDPNPCQLVGAGGLTASDTPQDPSYLQNDGSTDAQGNCLGQIYIFPGKPGRCRPPGWTVGAINNCCSGGKASAEDTQGSASRLLMSTTMSMMGAAVSGAYDAYQGYEYVQNYINNGLLSGGTNNILQLGTDAVNNISNGTAAGVSSSTGAIAGGTVASQGGGLASATGSGAVAAIKAAGPAIAVAGAAFAATMITQALGGDQDATLVASQVTTFAATAVAQALGASLTFTMPIVGLVIAVVMRVLMGTGCDKTDIETTNNMASRRCHKIGSYCEKHLIGCVQDARGFCCYNSILARIIQEQGRPQLKAFGPTGGWGTPSEPNCRGFTPDEFQSLDFSKIDLSEYVGVIEQNLNSKLQSAQQSVTQKVQQRMQQITVPPAQ